MTDFRQKLIDDAVLVVEMAKEVIDAEDTMFHSQASTFLTQAAMGPRYRLALSVVDKAEALTVALAENDSVLGGNDYERELSEQLAAAVAAFRDAAEE